MKVLTVVLCLILYSFGVFSVSTTNGSADKKEARDGILENDVTNYNFENFAEDVLQCNPRGNSFFIPAGSGELGFGECIKRRAVSQLLGLSTGFSSVGLSDSVSLVAEPGSRALPHYNEPPSIIEAMRHFLGHRVMRWQLDALYPGLVMRLGPMGYPEAGVMEFVLERLYDDTDRAFGPGKLLVKRTVLPLLLGFKLKLSTLMPLLLGGFFFLATKAVFFSKLAILFGAIIGFKTLLFGGSHHNFGGFGGFPPVGHAHGGGGGGGGLFDFFTGGNHHNPYGPVSFKSADADHRNTQSYESTADALDPNNAHIPRDINGQAGRASAASMVEPIVVSPSAQQGRPSSSSYTGHRNFAWDDTERGAA